MRTAKFDVPVDVLTEFLDAACDKGLKSTVVSYNEDEYYIEIDFEKEESNPINELEDELESLIESMDNSEEEN